MAGGGDVVSTSGVQAFEEVTRVVVQAEGGDVDAAGMRLDWVFPR